jgi:hypothetical protein
MSDQEVVGCKEVIGYVGFTYGGLALLTGWIIMLDWRIKNPNALIQDKIGFNSPAEKLTTSGVILAGVGALLLLASIIYIVKTYKRNNGEFPAVMVSQNPPVTPSTP